MIEFENRVEIDRPVEEVFDFVANFENVPRWNYYVQRVTKTSAGPVGIDSTFHQVRKTDQQDFRVVDYEPGEHVTVQTLPRSRPQFEMRFRFERAGQGTRVIDTWKLDTGRPAILERLAAGRVKAAVKENLMKLKELLETGSVRLQDGRRVEL